MNDMWRAADSVDVAAIEDLERRFGGAVLSPGSPGFDESRTLWNAAVDRHPGLVLQPRDAEDVQVAVRFAREHRLDLTVRGGGHGVGGHALAEGAVLLDLSGMREVTVDPERRLATAAGGALWGDFDAATAKFGLGTTGGQISTTGVAGLTLGGGLGWLMRSLGASVDNLTKAELVMADGSRVTVSDENEPELFWAVRGGGGNFGVVTSMTFRVQQVDQVLGGAVFWRAEQAPAVLAYYQELTERAPEEVSLMAYFVPQLDAPFIPPELASTPLVAIAVCVTDDSLWDGVLTDLRSFGEPVGDSLRPMPYTELQQMYDRTAPFGMHAYWRSCYLTALTADATAVITDFASRLSSSVTQILVTHLEGALATAPPEGTSFGHRDATHVLEIITKWTDGGPAAHQRWADEFLVAMRPHSNGGVYVNFLGDEGEERIASAYEPATRTRLAAAKAAYDPDNFFHHNQNIEPAGRG